MVTRTEDPRTEDRNYWTRSDPTNAHGYYTSFFPASHQTDDNPVSIAVGVALGNVSYGGTLGVNMNFARLRSSVMNVQLGAGSLFTVSPPTAYSSVVLDRLTIAVRAGGKVIRPLSANCRRSAANSPSCCHRRCGGRA